MEQRFTNFLPFHRFTVMKKIAKTFRKNWRIYSFIKVSWHFNMTRNVLLSENAYFVRAFRVKLQNCQEDDVSYAVVYAFDISGDACPLNCHIHERVLSP